MRIVEALLLRLDQEDLRKPHNASSPSGTAPSFAAEQKPLSYRTAKITRGDITSTVLAAGTIEPEETVDVCASGERADQHDTRRLQFAGQNKQLAGSNRRYGVCDAIAAVLSQVWLVREPNWNGTCQGKLRDSRNGTGQGTSAKGRDCRGRIKRCGNQCERGQGRGRCRRGKREAKRERGGRGARNLDYTRIISPIDGIIISRRGNPGQYVSADAKSGSLFVIASDFGKMQVWTQVNEADISRIKEGMDATFTVDAFPNEVFKGKVTQIRRNAQQVQNMVVYTVIVSFDNPQKKLLPYLTANVRFEIGTRRNVLVVPNAALWWKPDASQIGLALAAEKTHGNAPSLRPLFG